MYPLKKKILMKIIDIKKNIDYVLGDDQKDESRNKETINW